MKCHNCKIENDSDAIFCEKCGEKLIIEKEFTKNKENHFANLLKSFIIIGSIIVLFGFVGHLITENNKEWNNIDISNYINNNFDYSNYKFNQESLPASAAIAKAETLIDESDAETELFIENYLASPLESSMKNFEKTMNDKYIEALGYIKNAKAETVKDQNYLNSYKDYILIELKYSNPELLDLMSDLVYTNYKISNSQYSSEDLNKFKQEIYTFISISESYNNELKSIDLEKSSPQLKTRVNTLLRDNQDGIEEVKDVANNI